MSEEVVDPASKLKFRLVKVSISSKVSTQV